MADVPAIAINPGLAERDQWTRIGYKGGSEPGVLNFTTWLRGSDGITHCLVATWNNAASGLDEQQLASNYRAILRALRPEEREE